MLSWLLSVAGQALGRLLGSSGNLSNTDVRDAAASLWASLKGLTTFLQKLFGSEMGAWQFAHPHIVGGAWGLGELAYNEVQAWKHLMQDILPNSQAWMDGHTHQWVDAVYGSWVRWLKGQIGWLWQTLNQLIAWDKGYVLPHIREWIGFRAWFDGWPRGAVFTVKDWKDHPSHLATFLIPDVGPLFIAWLSGSGGKFERDLLTATIVDATPDIVPHVESAVVAVLLTDVGNET